MRAWQWAAVIVTVGLNAMDGFDVLSISFAAPGIAKEWGVTKDTLGWVLSTELVGMALGSILLGGLADRIGRRPTILGCLVAMAVGMFGAAHADAVTTLLVFRLLTGIGIGGMLASINAAAAECSNGRWRSLAMALMVLGFPLGGVLGGTVVQQLLAAGSWREVFVFGAWATTAFAPIVWLLVPESVAYLERARPAGALERINRVLRRFGHTLITALPSQQTEIKRSLADIFKPALLGTTILVTCAYFTHITSFYYILKWVPKIVVDMGHTPAAAAGVLKWANVGGVVGGALFGLVADRVGLKRLTMIVLLLSTVMIIWFGGGAPDLGTLSVHVALACLFANAGICGFYLLFAKVFPTHVRATGTGFAIGVGRGGAALAPVCAGYLFQAGLALKTVSICMACGSIIAFVALLAVKERRAD